MLVAAVTVVALVVLADVILTAVVAFVVVEMVDSTIETRKNKEDEISAEKNLNHMIIAHILKLLHPIIPRFRYV